MVMSSSQEGDYIRAVRPMKYILRDGVPTLSTNSELVTPDDVVIQVWTPSEFDEHIVDPITHKLIDRGFLETNVCKAEITRDAIVGLLIIPDENNILGKRTHIGYKLSKKELILIDSTNLSTETLNYLRTLPLPSIETPAHCLSSFIDITLDNDTEFLHDYEHSMELLEGRIIDDPNTTTNRDILTIRREISTMLTYYEGLSDMVESINDALFQGLTDEDHIYLRALQHRSERLESRVRSLKEYSLNLRELYQSQIDLRTNNTMRTLTIVTTIFMPLTVIGGWFGMNLIIPISDNPWSFLIVTLFALLIIVIETLFFKFRGWLK